jgi:hypothetical protein
VLGRLGYSRADGADPSRLEAAALEPTKKKIANLKVPPSKLNFKIEKILGLHRKLRLHLRGRLEDL